MESIKILIYGDQIDFHLLKLAITSATTGRHVWFLAPEAFTTLPNHLGIVDHAILKLIRFFYLKDCFALLKQLSEIQSYMQVPATLIVHKFSYYFKHEYYLAGYVMCHLMDAINHSVKRVKNNCHLILGCDNFLADKNILQKLINLYIDHLVSTENVCQLHGLQAHLSFET